MGKRLQARQIILVTIGLVSAALFVFGAVSLDNAGMIADDLSYSGTPAGAEEFRSTLALAHTSILLSVGGAVAFVITYILIQRKQLATDDMA